MTRSASNSNISTSIWARSAVRRVSSEVAYCTAGGRIKEEVGPSVTSTESKGAQPIDPGLAGCPPLTQKLWRSGNTPAQKVGCPQSGSRPPEDGFGRFPGRSYAGADVSAPNDSMRSEGFGTGFTRPLFCFRSSPRRRGPSSWIPACAFAGMSGVGSRRPDRALVHGGVHDFLFGRFVDAHLFDDLALARDQDAIRQRHDLWQIG
jgi:hypothetical protein